MKNDNQTYFQDTILLKLPEEYKQIKEILIKSDWLLSLYDASLDDFYDPAKFLYNKENSRTQYKVFLDSNIYIYLISAFREKPQENYRKAIALLCFAIFSEIELEPFLPVMEQIAFDKNKIENSLLELRLFNKINNTGDILGLMNYAIGKKDCFQINNNTSNEQSEIEVRRWFQKYSMLWKWQNFYLSCLQLTIIDQSSDNNEEKYIRFISWEKKDFMFSMVCTIFAMILFSSNHMKGMNKYKASNSSEENRRNFMNMTWDLYFIDNFVNKVSTKKSSEELLLASADKVVKKICKICIDINKNQDPSKIKLYLTKNEICYLDIYEQYVNDDSIERAFYKSQDYNYKLVRDMIDDYEAQLFD